MCLQGICVQESPNQQVHAHAHAHILTFAFALHLYSTVSNYKWSEFADTQADLGLHYLNIQLHGRIVKEEKLVIILG